MFVCDAGEMVLGTSVSPRVWTIEAICNTYHEPHEYGSQCSIHSLIPTLLLFAGGRTAGSIKLLRPAQSPALETSRVLLEMIKKEHLTN